CRFRGGRRARRAALTLQVAQPGLTGAGVVLGIVAQRDQLEVWTGGVEQLLRFRQIRALEDGALHEGMRLRRREGAIRDGLQRQARTGPQPGAAAAEELRVDGRALGRRVLRPREMLEGADRDDAVVGTFRLVFTP